MIIKNIECYRIWRHECMDRKSKNKQDNMLITAENIPQKSNSELEEIVQRTNNKIRKGLERKTASTGTPVESLSGGAKFMAVMANIGDGAKSIGGDGVRGGLETMLENTYANAQLEKNKQKIIENNNVNMLE